MTDFTHFVGIDWSGAKGRKHRGIAVALCTAGSGMPRLVYPKDSTVWSREAVARWIADGCGCGPDARILIGFDAAFSLPFLDQGHFFPALEAETALDLWPHVEMLCAGADDYYAGPFIEAYAEYYHKAGYKGSAYSRRMRVAENLAVSSGAGPCESVFHLIGPSQVGLSGLSTIRLLNQLHEVPKVAVWPYQNIATARIVLVEIYAAAFATLGGHKGKIRSAESLRTILSAHGAEGGLPENGWATDDAADALVTASGLRMSAHDSKYWNPPELSSIVRRTEGWIFGIV